MSSSISEYCKERKARLDKERADKDAERRRLEGDIRQIQAGKRDHENELQRLLGLIDEAGAEGVDTKPLSQKAEKTSAKIKADEVKIAENKEAIEKIGDVPSESSWQVERMLSVLKKEFDCTEATEVGNAGECIASLSGGIETNDEGRPCKYWIRLDADTVKHVEVQSGKHYSKEFRPESLSWLPKISVAQDQDSHGRGPSIAAYIDRERDSLILSRTELQWWEDDPTPYRHERKKCEEDFHDIAISLDIELDKMIERAGGTVDLKKEYSDNLLMAHVRSEILATTTTQPPFPANSKRLESTKIYQHIKELWDGFKKAPWSGAVQGDLALLKYLLENGERARFWCKHIEHLYGFRLRTRDHDWLVGSIYIDNTGILAASEETIIRIVRDDSSRGVSFDGAIASLGKMFIQIGRSER
ncbi:MAG: hypothetical protein ACYS9X_17040 [Planctomycetota bacterium]|jgi:hypothetical protein